MDATTVLGSKVNEGEYLMDGYEQHMAGASTQPENWLWQDERKTPNKLQAPKGWGMGGPPHAKWALRGCKKAPKRAAQVQYQATPYAPWASQRIGAGWEQPRAHEKGPVGRKKPQNGLRERSTRQHHMPPGQARG
ncbi:hypothetical protein B0H14DRAFT_2638645 [Mycena olivaceomarginata]|nr:hypothetical protein B0H14DRAFT_2638645 [Mycena olivaceomarginata]